MKEHFHSIVLEALEETRVLLKEQIEADRKEIDRIFGVETSR